MLRNNSLYIKEFLKLNKKVTSKRKVGERKRERKSERARVKAKDGYCILQNYEKHSIKASDECLLFMATK